MNLRSFIASTALTTAALLPAAPALAQQKVDVAKSEITFVARQMGVPVEGRFRKFDAQVAFDPKKPEAGKVAFTVDLGSATMGNAEADAELPKPTWFNTARFPQASFQAVSIKKGAGAGKFDIAGKLTIKGSSRDVLVPVTLTQAGAATTASGSFAIKRLEFKIGDGDWADTSMVADEVQIRFKLALGGVGPL